MQSSDGYEFVDFVVLTDHQAVKNLDSIGHATTEAELNEYLSKMPKVEKMSKANGVVSR